MKTTTFALRTGGQDRVHDITTRCEEFAREAAQGGDGLLHVFVPHATAGIAVMELGAGSDQDLLAVLAGLLPADDRWRHSHGSRGHGRSHVLPALIPPFAVLPVVGGSLALGTWQSIAVVDINADNPERQVRLSFVTSPLPGRCQGRVSTSVSKRARDPTAIRTPYGQAQTTTDRTSSPLA